MKNTLLLLSCILFFTTCKKEIIEPEHKNTGRNIAYIEFDGHKYLFEEKSFTFYKNIKGKFKSGEDNFGDLKPILDIDGDYFNFQGYYYRKKTYYKKKGNNDNQIDGIAFNISAEKDATGNWVIQKGKIRFRYYISHKDYLSSTILLQEYECNAYGNLFSPPNESKIEIEVLKINPQKKILSMVIKANAHQFNDWQKYKSLYIYFDIKTQY